MLNCSFVITLVQHEVLSFLCCSFNVQDLESNGAKLQVSVVRFMIVVAAFSDNTVPLFSHFLLE